MSSHRQQPYEKRNKPPSPTGSVRSVATKASTRSRMSGVTNMIKDKIRASNNKLKEKLEGAKSKWAEETIESSQKTQDGVQHIASSPNNPFVEIKDNNESTHSSPESLEGDYVPGRKFMDDNETPPSC
ncbi:hypothetical protein AGABI2DRAFT_119871 [Agaricus bisporus var. bisporus H97]|uniref:hypothetical protein n=1 Tax=Agaricus bisporus var. bisporus (strain H97 / ATCC MYA-4626 / FGSC 10389) TaxID=936046 RepID=UPI00029F7869|nr:hypothetical protein AGABI2DRAFT_119871 [Agaricus bisporus var. bisporus H97]EKV44914.1 hypothetical protein AGABI2DRAFT_119871 [Agaricus bisporus var. bisporus H97]